MGEGNRVASGETIRGGMTVRLSRLVAATAVVGMLGLSNVSAEGLDAAQTQTLLAKGVWHIQTGGEWNYFTWNEDGTLCVRMYDPAAASCDDEGNWSRDGSQVCYELTWWGSAYGQDAVCFTVEQVEDGPVGFHAKEPNGMTALYFSVPDPQ